ncbi:MAG: 30S ribosomal protein S20 [Dehalococcoidia bacterium]
MANSLSAKKRVRRNRRRTIRNKALRSRYKTYSARALKAIEGDDFQAAEQAAKQALSILDKTGQKGILHRNNVARRKSRLMRKLNSLNQAG